MPTNEPLSASQFAATLPAPAKASAEWSPFALQVIEVIPDFAGTFADHVLTLEESGTFRARQSVDGRWREGLCGPGCVGLVPAHSSMAWESPASPKTTRAISLFIPDVFLSRVVQQEWGLDQRYEILWQFLGRDPAAEEILRSLALEAQHGSPSGRLYAESACEFLACHVLRTYSSLSAAARRSRRGGLTGLRLRRVMDYIHDNLAQSLGLYQLAETAGVSPRHFERAFRQATGVPPHAYVTEQRVAAARQLLLTEIDLPIDNVARRVGFSSSSHLATAFRRQTGMSPRAFRALHAR